MTVWKVGVKFGTKESPYAKSRRMPSTELA